MMEMFNILFKNERHFGARSFACNGIEDALLGAGSALVGSVFSSGQVKAQQAWQDKQRLAQEGFVRSMWNANNEYNLPINQMKRLQDAGINPWMNLGQSQTASGQSSNAPSAGSAPSAPSGFNYNPVDGISSIASAFKSIAEAKKVGVETTQLEKTMKDMMRKIAADANSSEYMAIINQANSSVATEKAQKEMQELTQKIKLLKEEVFNANEEGKLITQKALRETEERYLTIAKRNLTLGEYDLVKKNIDAFDKRLQVELEEGRSRIANNYAAANEHNAGASLKIAQKKTEDLTRDDKVAILSYDRRLKSIIHEYKIDPKTGKFTTDNKKGLSIALYSALNEAYRLGYITDEEAGSAAFQGLEQGLKVLVGISESVGKVAGAVK